MRKLIWIVCVAAIAQAASAADLNNLVLEQMGKMPSGGKYSVSHFAKIKLQSAAHFESGKFFVIPTKPYVSFCSGATYLVFIKTVEELRDRGQLQLDYATLNQLIIRDLAARNFLFAIAHSDVARPEADVFAVRMIRCSKKNHRVSAFALTDVIVPKDFHKIARLRL